MKQQAAVLAGFWRRAAAFFIDSLILLVPNTAVNFGLGEHTSIALLINIVINGAYFAGLHSSAKQATPGKMLFGIRVTDMEGNRISVQRAIARFFATWLSAIVLMIGYLMAAFTARKQALHDIVCKTLVVNRDADPTEIVENNDTMPLTFGVIAIAIVWVLLPGAGILGAVAIPAYQDRVTRAGLADAVQKAGPFKKEVEEALISRRPIPAGKRSMDSRYIESVVIEPSGQVTLNVASNARGGKVFFAPLQARGGPVEWRCWSEGLAEQMISAVCKN